MKNVKNPELKKVLNILFSNGIPEGTRVIEVLKSYNTLEELTADKEWDDFFEMYEHVKKQKTQGFGDYLTFEKAFKYEDSTGTRFSWVYKINKEGLRIYKEVCISSSLSGGGLREVNFLGDKVILLGNRYFKNNRQARKVLAEREIVVS